MYAVQNPQELKTTIEQLIARKQELENSRSIYDVVTETFNQRWSVVQKAKQQEFSQKVVQVRKIVRLEIGIIESISEFVQQEFIDELTVAFVKVRQTDNLKQLNGFYYKYKDDVKLRQVIKLISAIYRYNRLLDNDVRDSYFYVSRSSLKSKIKYATTCRHCGEVSKQILHNMQRTKVVELPD